VPHQRAPAAADIEKALARRQPQLAADVVELGPLGRIDVFPAGLEIGARIDHLLVEPEPVEVVADVVVVADVGAVGLRLVSRRRQFGPHRDRGTGELDQAGGDPNRLRNVAVDVDAALDVRLGQCAEGGLPEQREHRRIAHRQCEPWRLGEVGRFTVGQHDPQRQAAFVAHLLGQSRQLRAGQFADHLAGSPFKQTLTPHDTPSRQSRGNSCGCAGQCQ